MDKYQGVKLTMMEAWTLHKVVEQFSKQSFKFYLFFWGGGGRKKENKQAGAELRLS